MVFRFEDITAFSVALGDAQGSLALPEHETVSDGEWVLAIFEIGSRRRATAAAARCVCAAGDTHIEFERRDWDRLLGFVAARSEHMRAARPVSTNAPARVAPASGPPPAEADPLASTGERAAWFEGGDGPPSSVLEAQSTRVPFAARVLFVAADAPSRDDVKKMLTDIGLVVDTAATAAEASARMKETAFDALVLDLQTHEMAPHEVAPHEVAPLDFVRDLRNHASHASHASRTSLPVLILSDRPSSREVVDAFACGADDFLPKPFRAPELGARLFGLLRRARLSRLGSVAPGSLSGPRSSRGGGGAP